MGDALISGKIYEGDSKAGSPVGMADRIVLPDNCYLVREKSTVGAEKVLDGDQNNKFEIVDPQLPGQPGERYTLHRGNPYQDDISDLHKDLNYYRKGLLTRTYESVFGETLNPSQRYNKAVDSLLADREFRSPKSMHNAVDSFVDLGMASESIGMRALALTQADAVWRQGYSNLGKPEDKLSGHRAMAILNLATAETVLQKGVAIPKSQPSQGWLQTSGDYLFDNDTSSAVPRDNTAYILADKQIDLGGTSLLNTFMSRRNVELAKEETKRNVDKTVDGSLVKATEVIDLDSMTDRIDSVHNRIQGKHDIAAVVKELTDFINADKTSNLKLVMQWSQSIGERTIRELARDQGSERSEYIGKLLRDQAIIKMALAGSSSASDKVRSGILFGEQNAPRVSIGGEKYNLESAEGCLNLSRKIDPSNVQLFDVTNEFSKLSSKLLAKRG